MSYSKKSHCTRGHKFTESNTAIYFKNGYTSRRCKTCRSIYDKKRYWSDEHHEKAKAAALARWRNKKSLSPQFDDQTSPQATPPDLPH